jgi:hypothetical protein
MDAALTLYRANQTEWVERMRACKIRLANALLSLTDTALNGPAVEEARRIF